MFAKPLQQGGAVVLRLKNCAEFSLRRLFTSQNAPVQENTAGVLSPSALPLRRRTGLRLLRHRKWNPHSRQLLIPDPGGVRALRAGGSWRGGGASLRNPPFVFPISISM